RQPCQAKFGGYITRCYSEERRRTLLREAGADLIQECGTDDKIVGHSQAVIGLGQGEGAQQGGSVDDASILRRDLNASFLPRESCEGRLFGSDVFVDPKIALVARNRRRKILNVVIRDRIRRSRVRQWEQILEHVL